MKDGNVYIDLVIAACKKISEYTAGLDEAGFFEQSIVQSAVIMQLQVIGEMAKKLGAKTKGEIDAPWKMIIGLRNIISHNYFSLELGTLWKIASTVIPFTSKTIHPYPQANG